MNLQTILITALLSVLTNLGAYFLGKVHGGQSGNPTPDPAPSPVPPTPPIPSGPANPLPAGHPWLAWLLAQLKMFSPPVLQPQVAATIAMHDAAAALPDQVKK